jgi:hypothetical protein
MKNYTWAPATGTDVGDIVALAQTHFETEIDEFFNPEPIAYSRNITLAIVNQFYLPTTELLSVARDSEGNLLAYTWAKAYDRCVWSDDYMVSIRMAHVDMKLSARLRIQLVRDMMEIWDRFAQFARHTVICSTTMRRNQDVFLKLHERAGYEVRGSYAYKIVNPLQATPANSLDPEQKAEK